MNAVVSEQRPITRSVKSRWWTGVPPIAAETFEIDCASASLPDAAPHELKALATRMNEVFDAVGLVVLKNTGLTDVRQMRDLAKLVVTGQMNYEGGANPRGKITPNIYEVGAPLGAALHYHHEMAYLDTSTRQITFLCQAALPGRGWTYVADNVRATDAILATDLGRKLRELGVCYHRDLTDRDHYAGSEQLGVYNHWQQSMQTDEPAVAEAIAQRSGLQTEWGPNRLLKTRLYASAFEYFPALDRNLLFASVADDAVWFDTWPKVMQLPPEERPLRLTFGDGSEMTLAEKQMFVDVYDRYGLPIRWEVGDVAVICNYRFAHGRPAIEMQAGESRELGVVIGGSFDRVGAVPDRW